MSQSYYEKWMKNAMEITFNYNQRFFYAQHILYNSHALLKKLYPYWNVKCTIIKEKLVLKNQTLKKKWL